MGTVLAKGATLIGERDSWTPPSFGHLRLLRGGKLNLRAGNLLLKQFEIEGNEEEGMDLHKPSTYGRLPEGLHRAASSALSGWRGSFSLIPARLLFEGRRLLA